MSPKRLAIAAGLSQEDRKRQRAQIGKLRHQVISRKTEDRYQQCFNEFRMFHNFNLNFVLPPLPVFDDMVSEYIEHLWESGAPKSAANYVVAAIQFYRPETKHHLTWSWKLVKVWNQLEVPQRATPLTPELLMAFAGQAFKWQQWELGWLLVVGFTLFLRTGELFTKSKPKMWSWAIEPGCFTCHPLKVAKRLFLPLERIEMAEQITFQAFRALLQKKQPGDLLWTGFKAAIHVPLAFACGHLASARLQLLPVQPEKRWGFQCLSGGIQFGSARYKGAMAACEHSPCLSGHRFAGTGHFDAPTGRPTQASTGHCLFSVREPVRDAWKGGSINRGFQTLSVLGSSCFVGWKAILDQKARQQVLKKKRCAWSNRDPPGNLAYICISYENS